MTATASSYGNPRAQLVVLLLCGILLAAGRLLTPAEAEAPLRVGTIPVPGLCVLREATGIPCPGCGLTRSMVAGLHGDWGASLDHHRLGWLVLLYVGLQAGLRLGWLVLPGARSRIAVAGGYLDRAIIPLMLVLLVNWIPTLSSMR